MKPVWIALPATALLLLLVCWQWLSPRTARFHSPTIADEVGFIAHPGGEPLEFLPTPITTGPCVLTEELEVAASSQTPALKAPEAVPSSATASNFRGEVVLARQGARWDGPAFVMIGELSGAVPDKDAIIKLCDESGVLIAYAKVIQHYHLDDRDTEPVVEIGAATVEGAHADQLVHGASALWPDTKRFLHGYFSAKFDDGIIACEGWYENGARTGEWTYWHENGTLRARGTFEKNEPTGTWYFWYDNGGRWAEWREQRPWEMWLPDGRPDPLGDGDLVLAYKRAVYSFGSPFLNDKVPEELDRAESLLYTIDDAEKREAAAKQIVRIREWWHRENSGEGNGEQFTSRTSATGQDVDDEFDALPESPKPQLPPSAFPSDPQATQQHASTRRDPHNP